MTASRLRAVTTAFLLGTATLCGAALVLSAPASAAVSAKVGKPLQEAQTLANAGNYKGALAKINEAEAIAGKTLATIKATKATAIANLVMREDISAVAWR